MMAGMPRESSFMPTIKCSSCGNQVEISMMGEHLCGGASGKSSNLTPPTTFDSFMPEKQPRAMPPRVDIKAANRSYGGPGELTPVSLSSGSRSASPKTPVGRSGGGRGDDYFNPRIVNNSPPAQQTRRPGGYGGFSDDGYDMEQPFPDNNSKKQASSLLQRMDSIAPGPFDAGRRPTPRGGAFSSRNAPDDRSNDGYGIERPGTSSSSSSGGYGSLKAPKVPKKNGYGGFGPPSRGQDNLEPDRFGINRSETFPQPIDVPEAPARTPSAPGFRSDRFRRPSNDTGDRPPLTEGRSRRPSMGQAMSKAPPRRPSISARPTDSLNLAAEFGVGNPYHSPSTSTSSSFSGYSQGGASTAPSSQPSLRSSPSRSLRSRPGKDKSNTSAFDNLMSDLQSSMDGPNSKALPNLPKQPYGSPSSPLSNRPSPPSDRGYDRRIDPVAQSPRLPRNAAGTLDSQTFDDRQGRPTAPRNPFSAGFSRYDSSPEKSANLRARSRSRDPMRSTRGDCKSCRLPITGKSISSADGRLTGRYHKSCFVCTTCREPFTSSTFYVLDDQPYCELHYHQLNGSLCTSCGNGIEGQYLEDASTSKHHPGCFKCGDCGTVLRDGYFEVNGQAFCEKDAWRRIQPTTPRHVPGKPSIGLPSGPRTGGMGYPGSRPPTTKLRMEKRMTRFGMM